MKNFKKAITGIMALAVIFSAGTFAETDYCIPVSTAAAEDGTAEETPTATLIYELCDDDTYQVIGCSENSSLIVIPETYNDKPVTSIGTSAFVNCTELEILRIPDSITQIGSNAFKDCTSLTSVKISASVKSIPSEAFSGCTSLTKVTVPQNVETIEASAFYGCTSLNTLELPESLTIIKNKAFENCSLLSSVTFPIGLESIQPEAFKGCTKLEKITLPSTISTIGYSAFYGCSALKTATMVTGAKNNGVLTIGSSAFYKCTSLTSLTLSECLEDIGSSAFSECSSLAKVTIPASVKNIGDKAFCNIKDEAEVTILNPHCTIYDSYDTIDYSGIGSGTIYIYGYENSTAQDYAKKHNNKVFRTTDIVVSKPKSSISGDLNQDGFVDAADSSMILSYYAFASTGGTLTFAEFIETYDAPETE